VARPEDRARVLKEHARQVRAWRETRAWQFLMDAGSPVLARKLLRQAIERATAAKKRRRGGQLLPLYDVFLLAHAIQAQEGYSRRRALLAAMELKGMPAEQLRAVEDRIRGKTLAQVAAAAPAPSSSSETAITGGAPVLGCAWRNCASSTPGSSTDGAPSYGAS
jgi:hypothetical protein